MQPMPFGAYYLPQQRELAKQKQRHVVTETNSSFPTSKSCRRTIKEPIRNHWFQTNSLNESRYQADNKK